MAQQPPGYLTRLRVSDLRCFREVELDLTDADGAPAMWTVLMGENGRGKTTLLQAIAASHDLDNVALSTHLTRSQSHRWRSTLGTGGGPAVLPLFAYGATRRASVATLSADSDNGSPAATLFDVDATLINAEEWLLRMDYAAKAAKDRHGAQARLDALVSMLVDILPDVDGIEIEPPEEDEGGRVRFHTPFGAVGLLSLGLGYQAMIAWMVDLAARLQRTYRQTENPNHEPCIVLVDEIDLHLHPSWQRGLRLHLQRCFPKAQFIVTAHSPLMVQASLQENLAVLIQEEDTVVVDNDPAVIEGWRVDQLLTSSLFGLDSARSPRVESLFRERAGIVRKSVRSVEDDRRLIELDQELNRLPTASTPDAQADLDALRLLTSRMLRERER